MIKYINNYEVRVSKCLQCCQLRHRVLSWVYENNKKMFYLGLTICGVSVTIEKTKNRTMR